MTPASATRRRIVFLDVDGTILEHGDRIAASTVAAIRTARAAGHVMFLSTGRSAAHIHPRVAEIGFDGAVTNSGAFATAGDVVVVDRPLPREATDRMLAAFAELGIHYFLQTSDGVFASDGMTTLLQDYVLALEARDAADDGPEDLMTGLALAAFPSVAEADLAHVGKAVFVSDRPDGYERLRERLGEEFHLVPGSMSLPGGSNGEINLSGTTKGSAIELVLAHLGMDAADAVAVGDSWNDVEMFDVCGVSVAMGNAVPTLKERADFVTTDVLDDGVWNAFERLRLV